MDRGPDQNTCGEASGHHTLHVLDHDGQGALRGWPQFQARLRALVEDHYRACQYLTKELLESSGETAKNGSLGGVKPNGVSSRDDTTPFETSGAGLREDTPPSEDAISRPPVRSAGESSRGRDAVLGSGSTKGEGLADVSIEMGAAGQSLGNESPLAVVCCPNRQSNWEAYGEEGTSRKTVRVSRRGGGGALATAASSASLNRVGAAFVTTNTPQPLYRENQFDIPEVRPRWLQRLEEALESMIEPERSGILARLERSNRFELLCSAVIFVNTWFIVQGANVDMAVAVADADTTAAHRSMPVVDIFFFTFYLLELLLRMWVHKAYFFFNSDWAWNMLDFGLVAVSCLDVMLSAAAGGRSNKMFLRVLRLLKLSKLVRVLRAVRFLDEMRQFFGCFKGCALSLFWAIVMIGLVLLVFALFFVQGMASYIHEYGESPSHDVSKEQITASFGSVYLAMVTLLELACGYGNWHHQFMIVRATGRLNGLLFVFFTLFFTVAVWNIVTSIFLENTLKMSQPDRETELMEKSRRDLDDAKELMGILSKADTDSSGMLSRGEFNEFLHNEKFRAFFDLRGIDIKDAEVFFEMIATSTDSSDVDLEIFVGSCLRVKGGATSIDLHTLAFENKMMHQVQKRFYTFVTDRFNDLDQKLTMLGMHFREQATQGVARHPDALRSHNGKQRNCGSSGAVRESSPREELDDAGEKVMILQM
eukprot:TRINITY_DN120812_c0_g1_i1.p1 TRINITY_DN120812_c0_g1~~TRINITY_DN120812_c0_g1_i1.p1  ORF type:complete len:706 (-),score=99.98 TRINITY_DN120812_c0_g1_i1:146-2263(-)